MARAADARRIAPTSEPAGRLLALDAFRSVAIVFVIAIHAGGYSGLSHESFGPSILTWVETIAVPAFFLADGYLFAAHTATRRFSYSRYLTQSTRRLVWPWLVFTLLYGLAQAAGERAGVGLQPVVAGQSATELLVLAYTSAFARQLYFLLSLYFIRTLSVLWLRLVALPEAALWILWIVYALLYPTVLAPAYLRVLELPGLDPGLHAFWGLQFYLLGIALARSRTVRVYGAWIAAGMATLTLVTSPFGLSLLPIYQYAYLLAVFATCGLLGPHLPALAAVGRYTMGIYLLHAPVILKLVSIAVAAVFSSALLRFGIDVAAAFLVSLALSIAISGTWLGVVLFGEAPAPRTAPRQAR